MSEANVADLLDAVPDALLAIDGRGCVIHANERACAALSKPLEDVLAQRLSALMPLDGERFVATEIVTLHRGTVGVQSELGDGSRFWIRLPNVEDTASTVTST